MRLIRGWCVLLCVGSLACAAPAVSAIDEPLSSSAEVTDASTVDGTDAPPSVHETAPPDAARSDVRDMDAGDAGASNSSGAADASTGPLEWSVSLGTVRFFESPLSGEASTLTVLDVPAEVEIRAGTDEYMGPVGFHVASTSCRPSTSTIRLKSGAAEVSVVLKVEPSSFGIGMLVPDACMTLDSTFGNPVAASDGAHVALISDDCRFVRVELASMSVDSRPVSVGGAGERCLRLERALDGRLYVLRLPQGASDNGPWTRLRVDELGGIDPSFVPRVSSFSTAIDAHGRELVRDTNGIRRLDEAGNLDPTFAPPGFGFVEQLVPISTGVLVVEDQGNDCLAVTRLDESGVVLVARHTVFCAESAHVDWIHEMPNGDLLTYSSGASVDWGTVGELALWTIEGDRSLTAASTSLGAPLAADDGTLYMMSWEADPFSHQTTELMLSMSAAGRFERTWLFGSSWTRDGSTWNRRWWAYAPMLLGRELLLWVGTGSDPTHRLLGRVRVR